MGLTFSRGLRLEGSDKLFKLLSPTFWALRLPPIMIFYAEGYGKFLLTFRAKILIRGHPFSLLSQSNLVVINYPSFSNVD